MQIQSPADHTPEPVRLVVVTHYFAAHGGGIELVAKQLADGFAREGFCVTWIASDTNPPPPDQHCITHFPVPSWNFIEKLTDLPFPLWSPSAVARLWTAIATSHVVHIHELAYIPNLLALTFARILRKRTVITQHTGAILFRTQGITIAYRLYARAAAFLAFSMSARLVFISQNTKAFFRFKRAAVIFNGVDTGIFQPVATETRCALRRELQLPDDRTIILFAGRFIRKKGLPTLEALSKLHPNIIWILVGSGPIDPHTWGSPNVRVFEFLPHRALAKLYQASDLLLLPSDTEGFPLVVQEALCCGLGVLSTNEVATACPAATHLIRSCDSNPGPDQLRTWHRALAEILNDHSYIDARSARAITARELWSWQNCTQQYINVFTDPSDPPANRNYSAETPSSVH